MENISQCLDDFFKRLSHTPGPWSYREAYKTPHDRYECRVNVGAGQRAGNAICCVWLGGPGALYSSKEAVEANTKLIAHSPELLRTICHTYLTLLTKFAYGQNDFVTSARISLDPTLAILRSDISLATGLESQEIQDTFESYARQLAN